MLPDFIKKPVESYLQNSQAAMNKHRRDAAESSQRIAEGKANLGDQIRVQSGLGGTLVAATGAVINGVTGGALYKEPPKEPQKK